MSLVYGTWKSLADNALDAESVGLRSGQSGPYMRPRCTKRIASSHSRTIRKTFHTLEAWFRNTYLTSSKDCGVDMTAAKSDTSHVVNTARSCSAPIITLASLASTSQRIGTYGPSPITTPFTDREAWKPYGHMDIRRSER